ncbi:LptF/LptG family permease [Chryseolinea sp. H1M3-3]|uniref:LptF/LptG family permease n=1 Tax=Chryseolinea sp. H1M3-3 TaxID=3034144 RepID=UPI0023ED4387|nr:LptF/LptG family permease [Chryseolinea sp. H1M3-3]
MKKIDKLVLDAFIGPFLITFLVVVFILLNINMLKYFDDIIGKGLDTLVLGELFFYFAIFTVPTAMPLAVLLSSLIAFGNLGEHFELTAIKSAGISLVRTLRPIFFFVILLTGIAFYANNNLVPKAALEAYSLLYDIKQKKPALDLREGSFYNGIDDISIKVDRKFTDDEAALKGVIVYDHRENDGNKNVIVADSGRMYTILNERYLKFELFSGYDYREGAGEAKDLGGKKSNGESLSKTRFSKMQIVFDLSSFQLQTTDKKWFQGNRIMRNLTELDSDIDSVEAQVLNQKVNHYLYKPTYFAYYNKGDSIIMPPEVYRQKVKRDSLARVPYLDRIKNDTVKVRSSSTNPERDSITARLNEKFKPKTNVARPKASSKQQTPKILQKYTSTIRDKQSADSINRVKAKAKADSILRSGVSLDMVQGAANSVRQIKSQIMNANLSIDNFQKELAIFEIQWHKILANSFACIAMFLIGAPLGAIIKKGGLGVPFLVSIFFFIVYYVITMQGEKLAKQNTVSVAVGVWAADVILLIIGLFFLRQARIDARLFEADFYSVVMDKVKQWFAEKRHPRAKMA